MRRQRGIEDGMVVKQWIGRIGAALASLGLLAAPAAAKVPTQAKPALWAVSDPDTTIYLFGTIHLLPPEMRWRSSAFDNAVANSDELVVETIVDDADPTKIMSAITSLAFTAGLPPLAQRVPKTKRAALDAAVKRSGFPPKALDGMETWAAAIMLLGGQFKDLGVEVGSGVETVLRGEFKDRGKKIGELETNLEQFQYFDRLPESAQRALLEGALEQGTGVQKIFDKMIGAWAAGDVKTIAEAFNQDLADVPELNTHIIVERNTHWVDWVGKRLAQPGTVLVAVGAGHLAGPGSVLEQLEQRGLKVTRLQ